jgi:hypothetical protein
MIIPTAVVLVRRWPRTRREIRATKKGFVLTNVMEAATDVIARDWIQV